MSKPIKAGELRSLVTVQHKVITGTGDKGQPTYTWQQFAQVFAKVEMLDGKKLEVAKQLMATATHQVTMRFLTGLSEQMRIQLSDGTILNVGYLNNVNNQGYQHIATCGVQKTGL